MALQGRPRLLLFDPFAGGHHVDHIRWLAEAWLDRGIQGELVAAVAPLLLEQHPELLGLQAQGRFRIRPLSATAGGRAGTGLVGSAIENARLLREAVRAARPRQAIALYMDHLQLGLALRLPLGDACLSGVLFRPSLHYGTLETRRPGTRERATRARKRLLLAGALRHPRLRTVFSLDPTAVESVSAIAPSRLRVTSLPDPADLGTVTRAGSEVRASLGVARDRVLMVLFGALDERKGTLAILEAIGRVPQSVASRLSLVLAGRPAPAIESTLRALVDRIAESSAAQVILRDQFVPDDEVQNLIGAADIVLAPYLRHVGSSGVLMRAAAAGRPVLSQDYGLLGWQVRAHRLGRTVDTSDAAALAGMVAEAIADPTAGFDPGSASALVRANTVEGYVNTIFDDLLDHRAAR